ncbi:MAG: 3-dehydroquinate synthase [Opitutales bacterium]
MENLRVNLEKKSYDIVISNKAYEEALKTVEELAQAGKKIVFVSDENVEKAQSEKLSAFADFGEIVILPAGEGTKNFNMAADLCQLLAEFSMDRNGALFAIGGGVIGDLVGFVASIYMRGIDFYQVPTTLLSMVDSSVGGKTGINIKAGKNLVGAFHQPKKVFIDTSFLETLAPREFSAGMAEVIKYAMICDKEFYYQLLEGETLLATSPEMSKIIHKCCAIKAEVVSADEFERSKENGRALLNLGHTFGHAVENCAGYGTYLHGEGVAIGLILAMRMSKSLGYFDNANEEELLKLLDKYNLNLKIDSSIEIDALISAMRKDKKAINSALRFVLMRDIGDSFTAYCQDEELIANTFASAK